jgi:hypothetical protein
VHAHNFQNLSLNNDLGKVALMASKELEVSQYQGFLSPF